ncbi:MAG: hypothetical protein ACRDZO_01100 [Egibacteraceae bacterium]
MTPQLLIASPLEEATATALLTLAEASVAMIVVGREPGPTSECLRRFPEAVLTAPGMTSRFAVADGVRLAGRRAITVLDGRVRTLAVAVDAGRPNVLLTASTAHLAAARDIGLTVIQPGWPEDVEPLLRAALDAPEPVLMRLHRHPIEAAHPGGKPQLGTHRILRRGRSGLLVGAGVGIPALVQVTAVLAARGIRVTAAEMHTIRRGTGVDPVHTNGALLIGPAGLEDARHLVPVPFGSRSPTQLADAIQLVLPRR